MGFSGDIRMPHVLVMAFPLQGHINPLLQFAKRLLSKGIMVTFVMTEATHKRMLQAQDGVPAGASECFVELQFETISDGLPVDFDRSKDMDMGRLDLLCKTGGLSLTNLIERLNAQDNDICCIVYDSPFHWVPDVAKKFNIPVAFFWTQSSAVYSIYCHIRSGLANWQEEEEKTTNVLEIPGLPLLSVSDLPSFLQPSSPNRYLLPFLMDQFKTLSEATWTLGNSFDELELEEINALKLIPLIRTVGPLIPSAFLDGQSPGDTDSGAHLWKTTNCLDWLNTKEPASVVYVSFGSVAILAREQTQEIALGLKASGYSFIWVIRPPSFKGEINCQENLPENFLNETSDQGLVVPWCPQLQVLSHSCIGAFMTHCGWNSTLESLSLGVPMLALPQSSDQMTNSLYIAEKWKTGLRLSKGPTDGVVGKEEVEKGIRMVMKGELGAEMRKNSFKWKELSKKAMVDGGSSDKNIEEFVEEITAKACYCQDKRLEFDEARI